MPATVAAAYLANVFSQLTRMLIFSSWGFSYFYFELCTKCLFTPESVSLCAVCPVLPAVNPRPARVHFPVAFYFYFVAIVGCCCCLRLAAVYFTALTIMSCPDFGVLGMPGKGNLGHIRYGDPRHPAGCWPFCVFGLMRRRGRGRPTN